MQIYKQSKNYLIQKLIIDSLLMAFLIGFILFIKDILLYLGSEIRLSNKSIILKQGLVSSEIIDIPYKRINSISINKGFIGNIFGYGDIIIMTGNDIKGIVFKGISNPEEIKNVIYKKID